MPMPLDSKPDGQARKGGTIIPIFTGSSTTYSVDDFLKRFNDLSNGAGLTSEEKFVKVFDYIDLSLENVLSIIRTCSYNDWPTFERMFRKAYYTESQGIPYVQYLIKTFQDKNSGFGIHIFLECFFAFTETLCKQGIMSYGQRFSLLTFALPPTYISFLRTYSPEANEWLSGMPSDVPSSESKWARLISLTKQYGVDQEILMPGISIPKARPHNRRNHRSSRDSHPNEPYKAKTSPKLHQQQQQHHPPMITSSLPNHSEEPRRYYTPDECRACGSPFSPHDHEDPHQLHHDNDFLKVHHDLQPGIYGHGRLAGESGSSIASPSILSTPTEYLTPLGAAGLMHGRTSAESVQNFAMARTRKLKPLTNHIYERMAPDVNIDLVDAGANAGAGAGVGAIETLGETAAPVLSPTPTRRNPPPASSRTDSSTTSNTLYTYMSVDTRDTGYTDLTGSSNSNVNATTNTPGSSTPIYGDESQQQPHAHDDKSSNKVIAANEEALGSSFFFDIIDEYDSSSNLAQHGDNGIDSVKAIEKGYSGDHFHAIDRPSSENTTPVPFLRRGTPRSPRGNESSHSHSPRSISTSAAKTPVEQERRVWELFLRANQKVQPVVPASPALKDGSGNHWDDEYTIEMPDEDIYNIDEILASRLDLDDAASVSSGSSGKTVEEEPPSIPVDFIMRQFMVPGLTREREEELVEQYAETITCYKMSEFVEYPEDFLDHIFEIVLRYTYHNELGSD